MFSDQAEYIAKMVKSTTLKLLEENSKITIRVCNVCIQENVEICRR